MIEGNLLYLKSTVVEVNTSLIYHHGNTFIV